MILIYASLQVFATQENYKQFVNYINQLPDILIVLVNGL